MKPTNYGKPYTDDQIALILLMVHTPENVVRLAGAFGRTVHAIGLVRRMAGYARPPATMVAKTNQKFIEQCIRVRKELRLPAGN